MAGEQRWYSAEELTARWLTVEQVMGRRAERAAGAAGSTAAADQLSAAAGGLADERRGLARTAADGCLPVAARPADERRGRGSVAAADRLSPAAAVAPLDGRGALNVVAADHQPAAAAATAAVVVPLDEHRALNVVTAGSYPTGPATATATAAVADVYQHPAVDLVAADAALASRWFTADPEPGRLAGRTVVLPFTVLAELATWPERLLWGHSRAEDLSRWSEPGRVIAGDDTVCRIWARITVAAQRAGSAASSDEAWIAAGCLSYGLPLATQHKRRYQYFAARYGLRLL